MHESQDEHTMISPGSPRSAATARLIDTIVGADERLDAAAFVKVLTPSARFRFGGAPAIEGREAVRGLVAALFSRLARLKHTIGASWESDAMLVYEGEVRYTLAGPTTLMLPYVNVLRLSGNLVSDYRIYLDPTPLAKTPIADFLVHGS